VNLPRERQRFPLAALLSWALFGSALAAPAGDAAFERTAICVAAMKTKAEVLGDKYRAGDDAVKGELTSLTEAGFAFIGSAYESGLRKEEADRRLAAAEEQLKSLPEAETAALVVACRSEGAGILAKSNALERSLVKNAARMRVNRLREK
jgi:hypothetical protein